MDIHTYAYAETGNTLSRANYVTKHLIVVCLATVWYMDIVFRSIPTLSTIQSLTVLGILLAVPIVLRVLLTLRRGRTDLNMAFTIVVPFQIYTALSYQANLPMLVRVITALILVVYEYETLMLLAQALRRWRRRAVTREKVLLSPKVRTGIILTCCAFCVAVFVGADVVFGKLAFPPATAEGQGDESEATIANNLDTLAPLLDPDTWAALSTEEKLRAMQTVADIEANYLGVSYDLNIVLLDLDENTLGNFNSHSHLISIDREHLEGGLPMEVLNTVCHEAYHAYQQCLCRAYISMDEAAKNLYAFRSIKNYEEEFLNYADGSGDEEAFVEYLHQRCETDARSYARRCESEYTASITAYLAARENQSQV